MEELHSLTRKVQVASEAAGLFLNVDKTKVMKIKGNDNLDQSDVVLGNDNVETVSEFCYLGASFTSNNNDSKEIRKRITIAKQATVSLTTIWKDKCITLSTKLKILHCLILPISTYGAECWAIKKVDRKRLQSF